MFTLICLFSSAQIQSCHRAQVWPASRVQIPRASESPGDHTWRGGQNLAGRFQPFFFSCIRISQGIDTVEEIVDYIESEFPTPVLCADYSPAIDRLTRNLFSKFCYYIKVRAIMTMTRSERILYILHDCSGCIKRRVRPRRRAAASRRAPPTRRRAAPVSLRRSPHAPGKDHIK